MKIRLYRPVSLFLTEYLPNDRKAWEEALSIFFGFKIGLPNYFWEIHLYLVHKRLPVNLTCVCKMEKDWFSIFYYYNLNGDLKKYLEVMLARYCKIQKRKSIHKKAG